MRAVRSNRLPVLMTKRGSADQRSPVSSFELLSFAEQIQPLLRIAAIRLES